MQKQTLAILSPNQNAYSETFIQAHKQLPFNIRFYYGGAVPTQLEGKGSLMQFSIRERIEKKLFKKFSLHEYGLYYSLKREGVKCILAEYGTTACESLNVIKALRLPLTVHFHGFDASVNDILKDYAARYVAIFDYTDTVISVSNAMTEKLIKLGCPENKIKLSIYGPNPVFYETKPDYSSNQFIAIGRFVEKKAPYLTILAFKKLTDKFRDAKLVMVGDGILLPVCKDLVTVLGLAGKVDFKEVLSPEDIKQLFQESIAFIQHSIVAENGDSEGTPVAILEAQAAALPVVATRHAGIPDIVIHGETGFLVDERDIEGMADYMLKLINNKKLVAEMGCKGRQRIANFFTMEKHLSTLADKINISLAKL